MRAGSFNRDIYFKFKITLALYLDLLKTLLERLFKKNKKQNRNHLPERNESCHRVVILLAEPRVLAICWLGESTQAGCVIDLKCSVDDGISVSCCVSFAANLSFLAATLGGV